jgi:thymidylate synthase (FAD)
MRLIKPSSEILSISKGALELIETAGRTCYKSEDRITEGSAPKFMEMVLKRGHESVLEHATATVRFICDRGVTHEIVRHRLASYSQESTRYCDYSGGHITFIIPPWANIQPGIYSRDGRSSEISTADFLWMQDMNNAEYYYTRLRELGWKPEQARSVLPNSLKTEIVMTANFREWRHFFKLRTSASAHPQMREVAIPLLVDMHNRFPVVFEDIMILNQIKTEAS